jgi:hypothetical protein
MTTLTYIFLLPLLAAIALAFVPRNFAVIMRAVAVTKLTVDKPQPKRLAIRSRFGASFIYSPPHTPKGPGGVIFF